MAARPRTHNISIPNLYRKLDKRTGHIYWQYKHPLTGRFHSLGTSEDEAKQIAIDANTILSEQKTRQILSINERLASLKNANDSLTVTLWLERYMNLQKERQEAGELKPNTLKQKIKPVRMFNEYCGMMPMNSITALHITQIIDEIRHEGHQRMAQVVRMVLIDVFKEAQHSGIVPPGFNPALATRQPRNKVKRQRLSLAEWQTIYARAERMRPYLRNGMLLAVVTGQRIGDICNMKFADIWDGCLHVVQEKTGSKLAIPLSLHCSALDVSLSDAVTQCRDLVVSKYLVHYRHATSQVPRGGQVTTNNLTTAFSKARDNCGLNWPPDAAPTFHEQRSLSERLYSEQGINTQKLLGHKSPGMTEKYHDDRGKDWIVVS